MHKLHEAIEKANLQGRLGLILYSIPAFPDIGTYQLMMRHLEGLDSVSGVEITLPVTGGFSSHANATIRNAHLTASQHKQSWLDVLATLPPSKPVICVLYEESVRMRGFDYLMHQAIGSLDGVLLEWHEPNPAPYRQVCGNLGVEFIECVGPWMTDDEIAVELAASLEQPIIYLMSAAMTGAPLLPDTALEATINKVRQVRPQAKIAAGFGIQTPEDVRRLARIEGLNAVIVGTAFLEHLENGADDAQRYLTEIVGALSYV